MKWDKDEEKDIRMINFYFSNIGNTNKSKPEWINIYQSEKEKDIRKRKISDLFAEREFITWYLKKINESENIEKDDEWDKDKLKNLLLAYSDYNGYDENALIYHLETMDNFKQKKATYNNDKSSRSHLIFELLIQFNGHQIGSRI